MAETSFGVTELNILSSSGTPQIESIENLNVKVGIGSTVVIGEKASDFSSPAPAVVDPNNTTVLNVGIVTANFLYGDGSGLTNVSGGGGGTSLGSRTTKSGTTGSIAKDVSTDLNITGAFKSYTLLKVAIDAPAWVVLYTNDTTRTADDARAEGTDPTPGSGVLAEVYTTTAGASTFVMTPGLIGWNDDGTPGTTIYAKVKNKRAAAGSNTITVTLTVVQLEA